MFVVHTKSACSNQYRTRLFVVVTIVRYCTSMCIWNACTSRTHPSGLFFFKFFFKNQFFLNWGTFLMPGALLCSLLILLQVVPSVVPPSLQCRYHASTHRAWHPTTIHHPRWGCTPDVRGLCVRNRDIMCVCVISRTRCAMNAARAM